MSFDPSIPIVKENISALRANISPYQNISTQGYSAPGDSAGASYYYNSSDTSSSDNGTTIIVDAAGHRYYRVMTAGQTPVSLSTTTTLTIGDLGQLITPTATCALTLPDATSSPIGGVVLFKNIGGTTTIDAAGSDVIVVNNTTVTTLNLGVGDELYLVRVLSGSTPVWLAFGGSAAFSYTATGAIYATISYVNSVVAGLAPLNSPAFTGTPTAPTASGGTNTTQIATTAFVHSSVSGLAPLASPTFTGTPVAPTAAGGTNTTQLATTAFVESAISSAVFNNCKITVFTGSGTYTPQAGIQFAIVELVGGGGNSTAGTGGNTSFGSIFSANGASGREGGSGGSGGDLYVTGLFGILAPATIPGWTFPGAASGGLGGYGSGGLAFSSNTTDTQAGGGGEYSRKVVTASDIGSSQAVTIGASGGGSAVAGVCVVTEFY